MYLKSFYLLFFLFCFFMFPACSDNNGLLLVDPNDRDMENTDENIEDPLFDKITLNPGGGAPLTGNIEFTAETEGKIEITLKSIYEGVPDFSYNFEIEEKGVYEIPILGLFADTENHIEFKFFNSSGDETAFHSDVLTTAPLPLDFPEATAEGHYDGDELTYIVYTRSSLEEDLEGIYGGGLVSYLAGITGIGYDKYGNVRWYSDFSHKDAFPMEIIEGEIWGCAWLDPGSHIFAYNFMGDQTRNIDISQTGFFNIHHDIFKTEEGNYLLTSDKAGSFFAEDHIIELRENTFELLRIWDLKKTIPEVADLFKDVPISDDPDYIYSNDPIHVNAVWHDKRDDSLIVTMQRNGMAKIASDGTLRWFLFPHIIKYVDDKNGNNISDSLEEGYDINDTETWTGKFKDEDGVSINENYVEHRMPFSGEPEEGTYPFDFHYGHFLLTPLDASGNEITEEKFLLGFEDHDEFRWAFRPHAPVILENGNFMLFDNGLARNFDSVNPSFSRLVEYEIIENENGYGGTVQQVWEHIIREDTPLEGWSIVVSEVDELENGNRLITSGALGSSLFPDMFFLMYGDGPIGGYIVEVDPVSKEERHSLTIRRHISTDHPNAAFSIYRSERVNILEGIEPLKK